MDNGCKTTVSVVLCTYNGEKYLREQLDSILAQTYPVSELIIQDDRSRDNTVEIAREYAAAHDFIHVHVNENNLGYNRNFLTAVMKAKGEAIAISDQDDIWKPEKLERQMQLFAQGYRLVFHNSALFGTDPERPFALRHEKHPEVNELRLALKPFIPGHECLFAREVLPLLEKAIAHETRLAYAYTIALACCTTGKTAYIDEPLVMWRRHETAATLAKCREPGAVKGILLSAGTLFNRKRRDIPRRYFAAVQEFPFRNKSTRRIVQLMQGGTYDLLKACLICLRHTAELQPETGARSCIKALFAPLHLLREGDFLIK